MPSYLNLFLGDAAQALALVSAIVVFGLLAALGRAAAGRGGPAEAAPLLGWSIAVASMLALHILVGTGLSLPGWLVLATGGIALAVQMQKREFPLPPAVVRAALIALPLLILAAAHRASEWDEFSHWAGAIRYVVEKNVLPGLADPQHGLQLPAYPFAFPLLNALASWAAGRFLEGTGPVFNILLLLGYGALAVRLAHLGAGRDMDRTRPWTAAIFAVAAASILNPSFVQKIILTNYSDTSSAVAAAFAGVLAWMILEALAGNRTDEARRLAWQFGLVGALLVSIRQTNVVIFVLVSAAVLLVALRDPAIRLRALPPLAPVALLPAVLIYALWRYHVAVHVGGAGEFNLQPHRNWVVHLIPQILANMAAVAAKKGAYFGPMLIALGFGAAALWRCRTSFDRLALIVAVVFAGYNAFLLFTYVAFFGEFDALRVASFWRYNMHVTLLGAAFFAYAAGTGWRRFLGERAMPRPVAPALAVLFIVLSVALAPKFRFDLEPPKPHFRAVAAAVAPLVPPQARFLVFDPEGSGESGVIAFYHMRRTRGVGFISAFHGLNQTKVDALFRDDPPAFVLVHSGVPAATAATGVALKEGESVLLRREGAGWAVVDRWPTPKPQQKK
ncbi:MAG: hypothetical protein FJX42_04740 [Alphaproteobacteria bacterium]|nr:hypothetical protein [Alphaproteobacteria bacterium]